MTLDFDPETHTYRIDGKVVPGVTRVIAPLIDYSMVSEELLRLAAERGSAIHKATELDDLGTLDEDSLDERLVPYLTAYRKFRSDSGWSVQSLEEQVYSTAHRFAGTLDRRFGLDAEGLEQALVDIKCVSRLMPATGVQLAGYALALPETTRARIKKRFALQLRADATYRLEPYTDKDDTAMFLSLLNVARWKEKHQ